MCIMCQRVRNLSVEISNCILNVLNISCSFVPALIAPAAFIVVHNPAITACRIASVGRLVSRLRFLPGAPPKPPRTRCTSRGNASDGLANQIHGTSSIFLNRMQALPMSNFFPVFAQASRNHCRPRIRKYTDIKLKRHVILLGSESGERQRLLGVAVVTFRVRRMGYVVADHSVLECPPHRMGRDSSGSHLEQR
jgi:hypothetical protein